MGNRSQIKQKKRNPPVEVATNLDFESSKNQKTIFYFAWNRLTAYCTLSINYPHSNNYYSLINHPLQWLEIITQGNYLIKYVSLYVDFLEMK